MRITQACRRAGRCDRGAAGRARCRCTAEGAEFDGGGAEIVAYDVGTERLFVANGSEGTVDVIDVADPSDPQLVEQVELDEFGDGINGVGAQDGLVGIAVSPEDAQGSRGRAVFLDADTLEVVQDVEVGFLPDALLFSPDARPRWWPTRASPPTTTRSTRSAPSA